MIEFVTLFLGFVLGPRPLELIADGLTDSVAIYLDGQQVARIEAPPWKCEVDFGSVLEPHRLEGRAYDRFGRELGRVAQLINYSRSDFGASLVLDPVSGPDGGRGGRLLWAAVLNQNPTRIDLRLDGANLKVDAGGGFVLPPLDTEQNHFLEAELVFAAGQTVRTELSFGGVFGDRVTSALTALAVTSSTGRVWSAKEVEDWFQLRDRDGRGRGPQNVRVFATKAENGLVLVVRSQQVDKALKRLGPDSPKGRSPLKVGGATADTFFPDSIFDVIAISTQPLKQFEGTFELRPLARSAGWVELASLLGKKELLFGRVKKKKKEQPWDALALAGRHAATSNRPRVVILMLGSLAHDRGVISALGSLHYLASVGVPLMIWAPDAAVLDFLDINGEIVFFTGLAGLDQIARRVAVELASQTIVWLEGEYLPRELKLAVEAPTEVRLVR